MSFRNDHDAALAHVDALQHEVRRLAEENEQLRVAPHPKHRTAQRNPARLALLTATVGVVAGTFFGLSTGWSSSRSQPSVSSTTEPLPMIAGDPTLDVPGEPAPAPARERSAKPESVVAARAALLRCVSAIDPDVPDPFTFDAAALERTAAPCRSELRSLVQRAALADDERAALDKWAAAEDALANRISLLVVYHRSDPERLDHRASAPQLWREYSQALTTRNALLDHL